MQSEKYMDASSKLLKLLDRERVNHDITIKELSDITCISTATIYDLMSRERQKTCRLSTFICLADALGLEIRIVRKKE